MWITSPRFDLSFIIAPSFLTVALILLFPNWFSHHHDVPLWAWVCLVLLIDVSHVYSTLFRTYFDRQEFSKREAAYVLTPLLAWTFGIFLYSTGAHVFWRSLAYIAVFHFVRQQYGFMMIYAAKEKREGSLILDRLVIYLSTIYPLVYWHTHERSFSWFVEHDFFKLPWTSFSVFIGIAYIAVLLLYTAQEIFRLSSRKTVSLAKNLLLLGTATSWYVGIVATNGDLTFTLTNVVSHGIPYIALVWSYQQRKVFTMTNGVLRSLLHPRSLVMYCSVIFLLAYVEEALWDAFVWREKEKIFGLFEFLPVLDNPKLLALLIPLLAVPQLTHYILDGFIWRVKKPDPEFQLMLDSSPHHAT